MAEHPRGAEDEDLARAYLCPPTQPLFRPKISQND